MIEKTKNADKLFMKHGVRLAEVALADKTYDLDDHPEVVALTGAHIQYREEVKQSKKNV